MSDEFGLDNKGKFVKAGDHPVTIDTGHPAGASPGDGQLAGPGFAGYHDVGGPAAGAGVK